MIIKAQTGLYGDGFLANPGLCGSKQVWDYYTQAYGKMLHVGTDRPCSANAVYRAYIRIALSSVTGTVTAASLNFYLADKPGPTSGVTLYEITDFGPLDFGDWSYAVRASLGTVLIPSTPLGWVSVNVTARVQAAKAAGLSHIAFVLVYQDEGGVAQDHWYAITAADNGSSEPYLNVTLLTTGSAPSNLQASVATGPKVDLSWVDNTSGATQEDGFYVERKVDGGEWGQIAVTDPDVTTYSDTDVEYGHLYAYQVRAHNAVGYTGYSGEAEASTVSSMPVGTVGSAKPLALGWLYNITPVLIDQDNSVYQCNDPDLGPIEAFDAVYVKGLEVTEGFTLDLDEATITFSTPPEGPVTCDVRGVKEDGMFHYQAGDLISWLLRNCGGVAADHLVAGDFAQFNLDVPYPMGLYITKKTDIQDCIDDLLKATLSYCSPADEGKWVIRQCLAAAGEPELELTSQEILDLKVQPLEKHLYWRVTIQGNRNWSPNTSPADTVSEEQRAWLKEAFRQASAEDEAIKELYPLAEEAGPHQTCLARTADCALLAQTILDVYGTQRLLATVFIKLQAQAILPGAVIRVTYDKWGFDNGRLARVLRVRKVQSPVVGIELEALV